MTSGSLTTRDLDRMRSFTLRGAESGDPLLRVRVRPGWPTRLAVRAAKRASLKTGGDGCMAEAWEVANAL